MRPDRFVALFHVTETPYPVRTAAQDTLEVSFHGSGEETYARVYTYGQAPFPAAERAAGLLREAGIGIRGLLAVGADPEPRTGAAPAA